MATKNNRRNDKRNSGKRTTKKSYPKGNGSKRVKDDMEGVEYNDPSWRLAAGPVGEQVHSYSFSSFLGVPDLYIGEGEQWVSSYIDVPTMCAINIDPSPGYVPGNSNPSRSAINAQALRTFTMLSSGNAKTTQYAPQDVATAILAIGEVISVFEHLRRVFGLYGTYNIRNRDFPRKIIKTLGVDPNDLIDNYADYRIQFNLLALQASKIAFPANIKYFDVCRSLYQDVFTDEEGNSMSQVYVFRPGSSWILDEYHPQGSRLSTIKFEYDEVQTMRYWLDKLNDMLDALMSSATLNYVYSDILRLAEKSNITLFGVAQLPDGYAVSPVYSEEALIQIENLTIKERWDDEEVEGYTYQNDVVPDVNHNSIIWRPCFADSLPISNLPRIFNFDKDVPDLGKRISASRFCVAGAGPLVPMTIGGGNFYTCNEFYFMDHYCTGVSLFYHDQTNPSQDRVIEMKSNFPRAAASSTHMQLSLLSKFRHAPKVYYITTEGNKYRMSGSYGDLSYYTIIDSQVIKGISETAFYELFTLG